MKASTESDAGDNCTNRRAGIQQPEADRASVEEVTSEDGEKGDGRTEERRAEVEDHEREDDSLPADEGDPREQGPKRDITRRLGLHRLANKEEGHDHRQP